MGHMQSCIEKICGFRFEPFPSKRVVTALRVVNINHYIYAIGPKGTIYTTSELNGKVCYVGTGEHYHAVMALKAFGLITAKEAAVHGEAKARQDKAFNDFRAVAVELERLTSAGIKLTKGQKATLKKMQAELDKKHLPYFIKEDEVEKLRAKKFE